MRLRATFKTLVLAAAASFCVVVYNVSTTRRAHKPQQVRVAHITADDLVALGQSSGGGGFIPQPVTSLTSRSPRALNTSLAATSLCRPACQPVLSRSQETATAHTSNAKAPQQEQNSAVGQQQCGRACRLARLRMIGLLPKQNLYVSRVQVENVTLPGSWIVTRELVDRLSQRQRHVQETCRKYGLDRATDAYQPNAWEFLIDNEHNLVWCNVFKAASSTWIYNFNLLAGYSEFELLHTKESPVNLARKRYRRPSVEELQRALNSSEPPLSFMIVRHPFKRLVSGYRDKILSGNRYYGKLSRTIAKAYWNLLPSGENKRKWPRTGMTVVATFPQFVQFLLDESAKGNKLDEHWIPMSTFCTPCLVPFDVFAKVETLQEDGNYIIFSSGINDIIKPKMINRSRDGPTEQVADRFLCQLTKTQMEGLIQLYKLDLELFQYDVSKYRECVQESRKGRPSSLMAPSIPA